ncbi:hypothetical protein CAter10_2131 [Collimonas arenae]|nr:hypothetical protein CAter10_2131 [Collimonas arenae]
MRQALVLVGKTIANRLDNGFHQRVPLPHDGHWPVHLLATPPHSVQV